MPDSTTPAPSRLPRWACAAAIAAPALVAAPDGTTNALALPDPSSFRPLYGAGSAARFAALGLAPLDRPNLADDVDTLDDLERIAGRLGPCTRAAVELVCARA